MQTRHNVHLAQACFALLACPLAAQIDRATLNGTVTDSSGAVVPGVRVEAISATTGKEREVVTNEHGIYLIPAIPVGRYTFVFSKNAFRTFQYQDVELRVGQTITLDARLDLASVSSSVEVQARPVLLDQSSAELHDGPATSERVISSGAQVAVIPAGESSSRR